MNTTTLRELTSADGPFASVYFEDSHDTADAAKQLELKWRELREALAGQGAPESTLDALEDAVHTGEHPVGRGGRGLLTAGTEVVLDEHFPEPPAAPVARFSAYPYLLPLAEYAEAGPVHVVAVVDQVGADLSAYDAYRQPLEVYTVEGHDHPVHKVRGGGSAHRDIQSHTEETVRHNVEAVAEEITDLAQRVGAEIVVLAGEVQARRAVHNGMPEQTRRITTEIATGARSEGSSHEELDREVGALLDAAKREHRQDVLERFDAELGRDTGLAVQGLEAVTTALREGNVRVLLTADPGDAMICTGTGTSRIAVARAELEALGETEVCECRADEAIPAAAVAVGASLVHVGEERTLTEGFGALLRHG
ncbi:peptide chain release factor 2 [Amycolatopsis anabasis]|uniref:Rv2629 family ribosome hibernation factor n=1 Tax=Amycolatopsis anabasis TaxID=1840409 RepID=UPI00131AF503|nr:peptide chain release factor 2 [Amycolatopsis anabasis]